MANEITVNGSLVYEDSEDMAASMSQLNDIINVTTKKPFRNRQTITTSEVAINLGGVASLGWMMFKNLDETNYIEIKTGTGGTVIGKMLAGESYGPVRCGSGITAPYAIANTASCDMEVMICAT
jgi:hypothetical protein